MQNDKRKLSPRLPMMNLWGCLFGLLMMGFGLVAGAAVGFLGMPYVFNYDVTQTVAWVKIHLMETSQADTMASLNMTAQVAQNMGTQSAVNAEATQYALSNSFTLLNQTATQSMLYGLATSTARAEQYNNAITQIALDQQGTQVSLQQNATQSQQRLSEEATRVQLNFQATQAAIQGRPLTATPVPELRAQTLLEAVATVEPVTALLEVVATVDPVGVLAAQVAPMTGIDSDFGAGINDSLWMPSNPQDWTLETGGVRAAQDNVVMASRQEFGSPIHIDVMFTPALSPDSDYRILFGRDGTEGYEVILNAEALTARQITLARANGELIVSNSARGALTGETHFVVTVENDQVTVLLNGEQILTSQLPASPNGNLAVSFPKGAFLKRIQVR